MDRILLPLACLLACGLFVSPAFGQHLSRRANIGIAPGEAEAGGIAVQRVIPGSTAALAGLQAGDIILSINDRPTGSPEQLRQARETLRAGLPTTFLLRRQGQERSLQAPAQPVPLETSANSEVIYDEIAFGEGWLRVIVNKPLQAGKHPAIYFIPGYTCSSVDNLPAIHPYRKLIDSLSGLGYAIVRVEKPGMGDNLNTGDCQQLGFDNELAAYRKGYEAIDRYDFIDRERVFLLGHSMGGVYAPLLGRELDEKGIVVYGTVHQTWVEYLLKMVRYQNPLFGHDLAETHDDLHTLYQLLYEHYYLGKSSKELYQNPSYRKILDRDFAFDGEDQILGRHEDFWREINRHNYSEAWRSTGSAVLSIFGEADFEAVDDESHRAIARIVDQAQPGRGTFRLLPRTDHSMIEVGSMEEAARLRGTPEYRRYLQERFNYEIVTIIDHWIQELIED